MEELKNNNPTLSLDKQFIGCNLTYINIMDYQLMQPLNATQPTPEQCRKLSHKILNCTMLN